MGVWGGFGGLFNPLLLVQRVCQWRGQGLRGPTRGKPGQDWSRGMGEGKLKPGELLPVSLGRGPGECSMCRGLVGASFPPSAPCRLIGEMWIEGEGLHMQADREYAGHPIYNVAFFQLQTNIRKPYTLCNRTKALQHFQSPQLRLCK